LQLSSGMAGRRRHDGKQGVWASQLCWIFNEKQNTIFLARKKIFHSQDNMLIYLTLAM
jgi:hypothetical protein